MNYVEIARSVGLSPYRMLESVGLAEPSLHDPDVRVSLAAITELLERSSAESGKEDFGLRMVEFRPFSTSGALGLVVREQPTVRKALEAANQFIHLASDAVFVRMTDAEDIVIVQIGVNLGMSVPSRQIRELTIANFCAAIRTLIGRDWRPRAVCFSHTAPADLSTHHRMFGRIVEFGHDFDGLVLSRADVDTPIASADPAVARQMERYVEHLGARTNSTDVDQVRERMLMLMPAGVCSAERVALHLGVDRRTVHRRLAAEGTTFSALLQEVRTEYAANYLSSSHRPLADVAGLLGFSAQSAFTRWFRASFGCTPRQWRADHKKGRGRPASPVGLKGARRAG
jgi:AraC-like DNA-binding protein